VGHRGLHRGVGGVSDAEPAEALAQARQAADGRDIRIGGGPSTIREFLSADLIDYLHIVVVPIVLGRGERLWDGLEALEDRFQIEGCPAAPISAGIFVPNETVVSGPGRPARGPCLIHRCRFGATGGPMADYLAPPDMATRSR